LVQTILPVPVSGPKAWALSLDDAGTGVRARSHFVAFLRSIKSGKEFIGTAELVFGELLGNVVRHAPGPVEIFLDLDDDRVILHVIDSGPPLSMTEYNLPADALSERGRGLFIVAQLASEVRIELAGDFGNHIIVTMARR
jgi:anti-sigma regulatory factor (Ser/Thr protein kinase)